MATEVAQAYVQIMPSAQGIQSQLQNVLGNPLEQMGTTGGAAFGTKLLGTLSGAGLAAAAMAAGQKIGQVVSESIQTGMNFDKSMSQVAATMGKTVDEIADLRGFALEMGSTTVFSAQQAADALNYMALAGYDAETAMGMLPNVLNLAAAGSMDLARASDMITDSQSALGLSLDDTGRMVDQMAMAASKSNTSVEQLGEAILTVGGTAKFMREETDGIATVLGILADNGVKGAEAGTHLRNIILSLSAPTDKAKAKLKELGVEVFDAQGNMRAFADIFPDLNAALDSLTGDRRAEALSTIFNSRDMASAQALLSTSIDRWNELGQAIDDSAGAAERMAKTQLDNLAGDITLMKSAAEGAQIAFADLITPIAREGVQMATDALGDLTEALITLKGEADAGKGVGADISQMFSGSIQVLGQVVDLVVTLNDAAGQIGHNIDSLTGKYPALSALMDHLLLPGDAIGNVNKALEGASILLDGIISVLDLLGPRTTTTADGVSHAAGSFGEAADATEKGKAGMKGFADAATEAAAGSDELSTALMDITEGALTAQDSGKNMRETYETLRKQMDALAEDGDEHSRAMAEQALHSLNLAATNQELAEGYPNLIARLSDFGFTLTQTSQWLIDNEISAEEWGNSVTGAMNSVINSFQEMDTDLDMSLETMAANLQKNITATAQWNSNMQTLWAAAASYAGEGGQEAATAFVSYMQSMGPAAAAQVAAMVGDVGGTLSTFAPMFAQAADAAMTEVYNGIEGTDLGGAVDASLGTIPEEIAGIDASGAASGMMSEAAAAAAGAAGEFSGAGTAAADNMAAGLTGAGAAVSGAALSVVWNAYSVAGSVPFFSVGYNISAGIASGISAGSGLITSAISSAISSALATAKAEAGIASPSRVFRDQVGRMIPAGVSLGISDGEREVTGSMQNLVRAMQFGDLNLGAMRGSISGQEPGGGPVNVTMNIYGAQGQSEAEIGRIAAAQLYRMFQQRYAGL